MRIIVQYRYRKDPETGKFSTEPRARVVAKAEDQNEVGKTTYVVIAGVTVTLTCGDPAKWISLERLDALRGGL